MDALSVFHLISELTEKEGVSCILIGGFAVNYYQVTRQTTDVDFLITPEDFEIASRFLEKAGYKRVLTRENFAQLESGGLSLMNIDFMFVDKETLAKIKKESRSISIGGQKLLVPSLDHLIALKLHSIKFNEKIRLSKDLPDLVDLIRINEVDVKDEKFKELCLKYGTVEIYNKILEQL